MAPLSLFFSSLLFSVALGAPAASSGSNLGRDLSLVQSFKHKITVDPSGVTKNWTGNNVCNFDGFSCAKNPNTGNNALSGIDLNGFGLEGKGLVLDGFLDKLTDLTFFHANSNGFTGSLPKDLSALKWLWEIDVSNNKLSGPFPTGVFDLNLTFLDLRFNEFSGPIPKEAFNLDLDVLFLNDNKFSGSIPSNVGSSPVIYLTLANNKLNGSIPKSIGNMKNVQEILLLGNDLSGSLPKDYSIKNLTVFDASDNKLSGSVPEGLCKLDTLGVLNLTSNNFSGTLGPACTALLKNHVLDVTNNCIQGVKGQKPASHPEPSAAAEMQTIIGPTNRRRPRYPTISDPRNVHFAELAKTHRLGKFIKAWDPQVMGVKDAKPRTVTDGHIVSDMDVAIPVRDGTILRGNIYRPRHLEGTKLPVIFNYSVYSKDGATDIAVFPPSAGFDKARITKDYEFEAADPGWWCRHGYIVASIDARGCFQSDGDKSYYSRDVGIDAEQPPSLAAIIPIDGMTDMYREMALKGGIPETQFSAVYPYFFNWGKNYVEDTTDGAKTHPYFDEYWQSKIPALSQIMAPAYIICGWGDHAIHTRGTLNAWEKIASQVKYLEIHQYQKWEWSVTEESLARQKAFLDHYLLGLSTEIQYWPKVRYTMRERYYTGEWRYSDAFPIPETQYTQYFLTPSFGLSKVAQRAESQTSYDASEGEVAFELPLRNSLEFAGHSKLKLWVEVTDGGDNLDLFITLRKKDKDGNDVYFPWITVVDTGPIGFGWLRASRRELDETASTPWKPVHLHRRDLEPLKAGDVVPVEIEIQPTSCRFRAGERLSLVVSGHDYGKYPPGAPIPRHNSTINKGRHVIHFGGRYDSHLLLPVIPPVKEAYSQKRPLVKMTIACRRIPGWAEDKFLEEYTNVHAAMTKHISDVVPILRNYTQAVALPHSSIPGVPNGGLEPWDAVTTLGWTSLKGLWGSFQAPEYKASAGKHEFADISAQKGILSQSFAESLFDPILFEKRKIKAALLLIFLAKSQDATYIENDLTSRAASITELGAGTSLMRYVLNREVTPEDTTSFFAGTPFATSDWHTMAAFEQYWFPDRASAAKFLSEKNKLETLFKKLPKSFDADKSFAVIGDENIVVKKDLEF
ncbi:CocE/NonD family Hydrolase [Colletotrichum tamarilloi]|uniref:CocE/NonD family Hydrolase n=1 Tax=Colletotrichum tamarilloi TaxID=1209934 RepID=A0ABQ9QLL5_9PEZI|nr:CocE/NonD family Hydrolase [Colletotrichum tamarilloi]KAK1476750.1 CocE/NonD family Hydrolase [Colletotrichum tamarilloi]